MDYLSECVKKNDKIHSLLLNCISEYSKHEQFASLRYLEECVGYDCYLTMNSAYYISDKLNEINIQIEEFLMNPCKEKIDEFIKYVDDYSDQMRCMLEIIRDHDTFIEII